MVKKFLLGVAVCCGVSGMVCEYVNGTNRMDAIVSDLFKTQDYKQKLETLVELMINKSNGAENTRDAIDAFDRIREKERQNEVVDKVGCMVWTLCYHWEEGCRLVRDKTYYVEGALSGAFGPYDF